MSAATPSSLALQGRYLVAPLAAAATILFFAVAAPTFLAVGNFVSMGSQFGVLALLALGQMFALLTRGFDISVGAVAALASVAAAHAYNELGPAGLVLAPLVGLACGAVNGWLIGRLDIQPIIATLGMLLAARGLALAASDGGQAILLGDPGAFGALPYRQWLGVPALAWLTLAAFAAAAWLLARTRLGRRLYMIGCNPQAAALVGVRMSAAYVSAYALCGLCAGLAAVLLMSRAGAGLPVEGQGMELQAIAAAVIGGTALTGGLGRVSGVLAGACFVQLLVTGLNLLGISPFAAEVVMGIVIVAAGLVDRVIRRATADAS